MTKKKLIALAAVMIVAAGALVAQTQGKRFAKGEGRGGHFELIATYLDLTEAQRTQAQAIIDAGKAEAKPYLEQVREGHEAMVAAVKANRPEAELKQIADAQGALMGKLALVKAKSGTQLWALLTPEQQAKVDKVHDMFKKKFFGRFAAL